MSKRIVLFDDCEIKFGFKSWEIWGRGETLLTEGMTAILGEIIWHHGFFPELGRDSPYVNQLKDIGRVKIVVEWEEEI